jgi:hypothetical protein
MAFSISGIYLNPYDPDSFHRMIRPVTDNELTGFADLHFSPRIVKHSGLTVRERRCLQTIQPANHMIAISLLY